VKLSLIKKLSLLSGILLVAIALADLVWSVILWHSPLPMDKQLTQTSPANAQIIWFNGIENHWLKKQSTADKIVTDNEPIQESRLAVKVQGVLLSNQAERSVVLLNYRNQDRTLSVGDALEEGILLVAIKQKALIFNRNGVLEQVLLDLDNASKLNQPQSQLKSQLTGPVTTQRVGSRILEETFGPNFRQSLVSDPLQLMSYIRVLPSSKEGQLQGFLLQPGSKPELFNHFGLKAGDLLVAVDGNPVSDTSAMMALHSRLATAEALDIDLLRGSEHLKIRLEME